MNLPPVEIVLPELVRPFPHSHRTMRCTTCEPTEKRVVAYINLAFLHGFRVGDVLRAGRAASIKRLATGRDAKMQRPVVVAAHEKCPAAGPELVKLGV